MNNLIICALSKSCKTNCSANIISCRPYTPPKLPLPLVVEVCGLMVTACMLNLWLPRNEIREEIREIKYINTDSIDRQGAVSHVRPLPPLVKPISDTTLTSSHLPHPILYTRPSPFTRVHLIRSSSSDPLVPLHSLVFIWSARPHHPLTWLRIFWPLETRSWRRPRCGRRDESPLSE